MPDTAAARDLPAAVQRHLAPDRLAASSSPRDVLVLIVAPISIVALALFMTRTKLGLLGAGLGVEPRHRAALRHQRQADIDDRVDDRRRVRRG